MSEKVFWSRITDASIWEPIDLTPAWRREGTQHIATFETEADARAAFEFLKMPTQGHA